MKTIAITCRMESFDSQSKWFINATYVDACSQYGCALFPIVSYASLAVAATSCDALIVCGGYDYAAIIFKKYLMPLATSMSMHRIILILLVYKPFYKNKNRF